MKLKIRLINAIVFPLFKAFSSDLSVNIFFGEVRESVRLAQNSDAILDHMRQGFKFTFDKLNSPERKSFITLEEWEYFCLHVEEFNAASAMAAHRIRVLNSQTFFQMARRERDRLRPTIRENYAQALTYIRAIKHMKAEQNRVLPVI